MVTPAQKILRCLGKSIGNMDLSNGCGYGCAEVNTPENSLSRTLDLLFGLHMGARWRGRQGESSVIKNSQTVRI